MPGSSDGFREMIERIAAGHWDNAVAVWTEQHGHYDTGGCTACQAFKTGYDTCITVTKGRGNMP